MVPAGSRHGGGRLREVLETGGSVDDHEPAGGRPGYQRAGGHRSAWQELGERASVALAEEHFEPELAIRERVHRAQARAWQRRPRLVPRLHPRGCTP